MPTVAMPVTRGSGCGGACSVLEPRLRVKDPLAAAASNLAAGGIQLFRGDTEHRVAMGALGDEALLAHGVSGIGC